MCHEKCFLRLEPRMGRKNRAADQNSAYIQKGLHMIFCFAILRFFSPINLPYTINLYLRDSLKFFWFIQSD